MLHTSRPTIAFFFGLLLLSACSAEPSSPGAMNSAAGSAGSAGSSGAGSGGAGGVESAGTGGTGAAGAGGGGASGMGAGQGGISGASAGEGGMGSAGTMSDPSCVPDAAIYESTIRPILDQRCAGCHGTTPDFGAPFSLLAYDDVIALYKGTPVHQRMVAQLGAGTMPPAGNIRPTPDEHDAIVAWASCGMDMPAYPTSLVANRPTFEAAGDPPAGLERIELLAEGFSVPAGTMDHYEQFTFNNVVTSDKFVRRFDVQIDKSRVVHHITLRYGSLANNRYLYTWAPGTGAVEFPNGGLRIKPTDSFRMQIHYNNVAGEGDMVDSSGIVLLTGDPEGTEYIMLDPAANNIVVQAGTAGSSMKSCTAMNDFHILAGMPHMHEIGDTFSHTIEHQDGTSTSVIDLSGWSFDLQYFYDMNVDTLAGDVHTIRCDFINDKERTVTFGQGTTDEMCFDFIYVTPATAQLSCQ